MIHIRFIAADQSVQNIQAQPGQSLMKAAVDAGIQGIEADCGGTLTCATCHVMLDAPWADRLPPPVADEHDMPQGWVAALRIDGLDQGPQFRAQGLFGYQIDSTAEQARFALREQFKDARAVHWPSSPLGEYVAISR